MAYRRKLLEVSIPVQGIAAAAAGERFSRETAQANMHLWWGRRPGAWARAILLASLVDDPSSHPELFSTSAAQEEERRRLHELLLEFARLENANNEQILAAARKEIEKYTDKEELLFFDPFAGDGSWALEARRLGLRVKAQDVNPVAVLIGKAMLELPSLFDGLPAVNPISAKLHRENWPGANGLSADVRYYGNMLLKRADEQIGHFYPDAIRPDGGKATVIAWIWARTVKCPDCACSMPLASSFDLSRVNRKPVYINPVYSNAKISYEVKEGNCPIKGTIARMGARCPCCSSPVAMEYIKAESQAGRLGSDLMAIVAEDKNGRVYLAPDDSHIAAAHMERPADCPAGELRGKARETLSHYGMDSFADLFTPRQLLALTTFSSLIHEIMDVIEEDAIAAGLADDGKGVAAGGTGAKAYAEAIGVYLALAVDRAANLWSAFSGWMNDRGALRETLFRPALAMIWNYAEANPFSSSGGSFLQCVNRISQSLSVLPAACYRAEMTLPQTPAVCKSQGFMVSTGFSSSSLPVYADLSAYFHIWLRKSLLPVFPELFPSRVVSVNKKAAPAFLHFHENGLDGKDAVAHAIAQELEKAAECIRKDVPLTIYYNPCYNPAAKNDKKNADPVFSSLIPICSALIDAGFVITAVWPADTAEKVQTTPNAGNNAPATLVLVCRRRTREAPQTTLCRFNAELVEALPAIKRELRKDGLEGRQLAYALAGQGLRIFSSYSKVVKENESYASVGEGLKMIKTVIDDIMPEF